MRLTRYCMRDDQRRAMFAKMGRESDMKKRVEAINGPPPSPPGPDVSIKMPGGSSSSDDGSFGYSFTVPGNVPPGAEPKELHVGYRMKADDPIVETVMIGQESLGQMKYDSPEFNVGDRILKAKSKLPEKEVYIRGEGVSTDFKSLPYDVDRRFILQEEFEIPEPESVFRKKGFVERVTGPITGALDATVGEYGRGFSEEFTKQMEGAGRRAGAYTATAPRRFVEGSARYVGEGVKSGLQHAPEYLAPGVEAGATIAGRAVADVIAVGADVMQAPNREFWMPPGIQPVWTGTSYEYKRVPRYPMEPWAVSRGMGIGMPPDVEPRVKGQEMLPTLEAAKFFGGDQFISKERGYGGADTRYTSKEVGMVGQMPVLFPRVQTPDFFRYGYDRSMNWLIPPTEAVRPVGTKVPPRRTEMLMVPRSVSGGGLPSQQMLPTRASSPVTATLFPKLEVNKPPKEFKSLPDATKFPKPLDMGAMPRSVKMAVRDKQRYDVISGMDGSSSPEAVKLQARMQSKADYASRHTEPGTPGRYVLEQSGLVSGV
jgi:hypothetical protein